MTFIGPGSFRRPLLSFLVAAAVLATTAGCDSAKDSPLIAPFQSSGDQQDFAAVNSLLNSPLWTWGNWARYRNSLKLSLGRWVPANSNCTGVCSKGNYNMQFKSNRCGGSGKNAAWTPNRVVYDGVEWAKSGTAQDHGGVCATEHPTAGKPLFHDGCTGYPPGNPAKVKIGPLAGWNPPNYGQLFHGACVVHDHCFHAEPAFSGKSKAKCDREARKMMDDICRASYRKIGVNRPRCLLAAKAASLGMDLGSSKHYKQYNMGYDYRVNALCKCGQTYDIVRGQCVSGGPRCSGGGGGGGSGGGDGPGDREIFNAK